MTTLIIIVNTLLGLAAVNFLAYKAWTTLSQLDRCKAALREISALAPDKYGNDAYLLGKAQGIADRALEGRDA